MSSSSLGCAVGALLLLGATTGCAHSAASPAPPVTAGLDPSEEITPEELSTLPEPVPANPSGGTGAERRAPLTVAQAAPRGDSSATRAIPGEEGPLWRVQIFATQDRVLADRMAGEAVALLRSAAYVAFETPLYKVRLGDYRSEQEAAPLRDKAVRLGFPGAFRVRCLRAAVTYKMD